MLQPTYQNREAIEEARTGGIGTGGASQYNQSGTGTKMPSLNNNLSELDTLLQDLSNARYNSHATERGSCLVLISSLLIGTKNVFPRYTMYFIVTHVVGPMALVVVKFNVQSAVHL